MSVSTRGRVSAITLALVALGCATKPASDSRSSSGPQIPGDSTVSACSKLVKTKLTQIPAAPFASLDADMAWTGDGVVVWSHEGDEAAVYLASQRRWTSLDATFTGMLVRGVGGPYLVTTPDGQYPNPLTGLIIDTNTSKTRPLAAPTKVMLEPLTIGDMLLFSADARAPISSDNPVVFDPRTNNWTTVSGPLPADFARRNDRADVVGDGFLFRWGGGFDGTAHADGSLIEMATATRTLIPSHGAPSARSFARVAAQARRVAVWGGDAVDPAQPGRRIPLDDGGIYELDTQTWRPIPALADAPWTTQRNIELTEQALVVWGDRDNTPLFATFDLVRERWSVVALPEVAAEHYGRVVHQIDAGLVVFVGQNKYGILDPTDPALPRWCEAPLPDGAAKRANLRSTWTGDALVLWGGTASGHSGGCENHRGEEGCDPYVEHIPMSDGWLLELRER